MQIFIVTTVGDSTIFAIFLHNISCVLLGARGNKKFLVAASSRSISKQETRRSIFPLKETQIPVKQSATTFTARNSGSLVPVKTMQDFAERGCSVCLQPHGSRLFITEHGPRFRLALLSIRFSRQFRLIPRLLELLGNGVRPRERFDVAGPSLHRQLYVYMRPYTTLSRQRAGHTSPNRDPREAEDDVVSPIKARSTVQFVSRAASCTVDRKI